MLYIEVTTTQKQVKQANSKLKQQHNEKSRINKDKNNTVDTYIKKEAIKRDFVVELLLLIDFMQNIMRGSVFVRCSLSSFTLSCLRT